MPYERDKLIRFHHCDPAGIVFYPQYFVLMNELVEDWFDEGLGHPFSTFHGIERLGLPMAHLECDFLVPSRVGDRLTFRLEVEKLGNASMTLAVTASRGGSRPHPRPARRRPRRRWTPASRCRSRASCASASSVSSRPPSPEAPASADTGQRAVGASLRVIDADARRMRGERLLVFTNL